MLHLLRVVSTRCDVVQREGHRAAVDAGRVRFPLLHKMRCQLTGNIAFSEGPNGGVVVEQLIWCFKTGAALRNDVVTLLLDTSLRVQRVLPVQGLRVLGEFVQLLHARVEHIIGLDFTPEFTGGHGTSAKLLRALRDRRAEHIRRRLNVLVVIGRPSIGRDLGYPTVGNLSHQ